MMDIYRSGRQAMQLGGRIIHTYKNLSGPVRADVKCRADHRTQVVWSKNMFLNGFPCVKCNEWDLSIDLNEPVKPAVAPEVVPAVTHTETAPVVAETSPLPLMSSHVKGALDFCKAHALALPPKYESPYRAYVWVCSLGHKFSATYNALKGRERSQGNRPLCIYCEIDSHATAHSFTMVSPKSVNVDRLTVLQWRCTSCMREYAASLRNPPSACGCWKARGVVSK
jgi:hypothetical protein